MKSSSPAMLALLLLAAASPCEALLRASGSSHSTRQLATQEAVLSGSAELNLLEAEEARFWASEWSSLEDELKQLAALANGTSNATAAPAAAKAEHVKSVIPKNLNLNPKSVADLMPALAMLKGLYEDGKDRIVKLNEREKEMAKKYEEKEVQHKARIDGIEAKFHNHTLSQEFYTNETRDENRIFLYWKRCRDRQHHQYRTGLKIQHSTMDKVKKMIDMYEQTMAGNTEVAKKELKKLAPPEIVFLQASVASFCKEALGEIDTARSEMAADLTARPL
eukprot:TRINITY_DN10580_c0_g1_i1.p1 TRINITY_DN10580_c0_g1~~TRINITY_DN10580_c0_g1_i1.p1  ORF type:complete len:278 (+),score=109.85 TRINITY_DN10580_c0_g1_i1:79-912(+)